MLAGAREQAACLMQPRESLGAGQQLINEGHLSQGNKHGWARPRRRGNEDPWGGGGGGGGKARRKVQMEESIGSLEKEEAAKCQAVWGGAHVVSY